MFTTFLNDLYASTPYKNWAKTNGTDASRWKTYAAALVAGQTPTPPVLSSTFGKALLEVAKLAQKAAPVAGKAAVYGQGVYGQGIYS